MTPKPIKLIAEYIRETVHSKPVQIIIKNRTIMVAGENYSGVALYNSKDKSFKFMYVNNIEALLANDDEEIFEETDVKKFCEWMSK